MSDDSIESAGQQAGGVSRRAALKAGVAAGVGAVAWSGPTITSLGGTPAYAAGCTFVVIVDLSGGCRNTDMGTPQCSPDPYRYHQLKDQHAGLPAGYGIDNNIAEGTCCGAINPADPPVFTFPDDLQCTVVLRFWSSGGKADPTGPGAPCSQELHEVVFGPSASGELPLPLDCYTFTHPSNTFYNIEARCNTIGADPLCLR